MNSINLQEFAEGAAYQVHAVLETISRLGERVEVYDGERLVGIILRGDPITNENESLPKGITEGSPALGKDISLDALLEQHQKKIEQYEAEERQATQHVA